MAKLVLTEQRRNELAYAFLKLKMSQEGFRLGPQSMRDIGRMAKELGVEFKEARAFVEGVVRELMDEMFRSVPSDADEM